MSITLDKMVIKMVVWILHNGEKYVENHIFRCFASS
jgi:hypothetical protein